MFKKTIAQMLIICILLGCFNLTSFAFVTTPSPGWGSVKPDITPERQKVVDTIRHVIVPNIVDRMLVRFPAFKYLETASILYGFEIISDFFNPVTAAVGSNALTSNNQPIAVNHRLIVNIGTPKLMIGSDGNFIDRSLAEHVIAHEMVHAFMFESMRAGIGTSNESYPLWFVEGAAQAIGGDTRQSYDIKLGLDRGAASTDDDIKNALAKIADGDSTSAYGIGYLANMYLGYLVSGQKGINSDDISEGLNTIFAELIFGTSLDETIAKHTHYTSLADFELRLQDDTDAYDFVRDLFSATPPRREEKGGALLANNLMDLDFVSDTTPTNPKKLFEVSDQHTVVQNKYPQGVQIEGGGKKSLSGVPQVANYPKPPSTKKPLDAPNLTLIKSDDKITISWDDVPDAAMYEISIYTKDSTVLPLTDISDTFYEFPMPTKTGLYVFSVKALPAVTDTVHYAGKLSIQEHDFVSIPILKNKGIDFITISSEFNQEYSIDGGATWVGPPASNKPNKPGDLVDFSFPGLNPNQEYNIISRVISKKTLSLPLVVSTNGVLPPSISTSSLPNGEIGTAYSHTLTASGSQPITWSITAGKLPQGLVLTANVISGTPTVIGDFPVTVRAENSAGSTTENLTLTIEKRNIIFSVDPIADQTFTGTPLTPFLTVTDGSQTLTQGVDYTATYTNNTNIGTATVTITGIGTYLGNTGSGTFQIIKAPLAQPPAIKKHFLSTNLPVGASINVASVLPKDRGASTYTVGSVIDPNTILDGIPTSIDSIVSFNINSGNLGDTATIPVNVTMENYQDAIVNILITLTDKINADDTITFDNTQITYGDSYAPTPSTTLPNAGTWLYSYVGTGVTSYGPSPNPPTLAGTYSVTTIFENSTHRGEKTADLIINRIVPVLNFPTASSVNYGDKLSTSTLSGNTVLGSFAWRDANILPIVTNSGYNVIFTPIDTTNYDWSGVPGWNGGSGIVEQAIKLSVIPKALTITADNKTIAYGATKPTYTAVTKGLLLADTISGITFTDNAVANTSGNFQITPAGGAISSGNANYTIQYINGVLTIQPPITYTIAATSAAGGSISPAGAVSVIKGENKTFTITPNSGYRILDVLVDGVSKGAISTYTFTKADKNHTISATFRSLGNSSSSNNNNGGNNNPSSSSTNYDIPWIVTYPEKPPINITPSSTLPPASSASTTSKRPASSSATTNSTQSSKPNESASENKETDIKIHTSAQSSGQQVQIQVTLPDQDTVMQAVLTSDERKRVENGESLEIVLNINQESSVVPSNDKQLVQETVEQHALKLGKYLDMTIKKRIGDADWQTVSDLNNSMQIKLDIPSELLEENRIFSIIRVHDGKANILADLDNQVDTITFETQQFSSYAIVYKDDIPVVAPEADTADTTTKFNIVIPIAIVGILLIIGALVFVFLKRRSNDDYANN